MNTQKDTDMSDESCLTRVGKRNSEKESLFTQFGTPPSAQSENFDTQFWISNRVEEGSAEGDSIMKANSPPAPKWKIDTASDGANGPIKIITIGGIPRQVLFLEGKVPSMIEKPFVAKFAKKGIAEFGKKAGRHQDDLVQDLICNSEETKKRIDFTGEGVTCINDYTSGNKESTTIILRDILDTATKLRDRNAEGFSELGGKYAMVIHADVARDIIDLVFLFSTDDRIRDMYRNTPKQVKKDLRRHYVGAMGDVVIFASPRVQKKKSDGEGSPYVYPCYFIGKDAYGCVSREMVAIYTDRESGINTKPATFFLEWEFKCKVLRNENIQVLMVQSSR